MAVPAFLIVTVPSSAISITSSIGFVTARLSPVSEMTVYITAPFEFVVRCPTKENSGSLYTFVMSVADAVAIALRTETVNSIEFA